MYDLIIIGGGPGGYHAARLAGRAGMKTLLFEKNELGGVCLNEGCIPSKTLLHSAKILDCARNGKAYGVKAAELEFDHNAVIARKNGVVKKLVFGVKTLMNSSGVTVICEEAEIVGRNLVKAGDETFETKHIIIAAGSEPVIPPLAGLSEAFSDGFVLTNREILDLCEIPENLAIIGAGAIGLEMASYFSSAGSKVTVIEMLPKIAGQTDGEISNMLMEALMKKGVHFVLNTKVTAIERGKVKCEESEVTADKVLLSIGRRPVTKGYGLENAGVALYKGAIATDANMLTSVPNIYAVGDVNGKHMLAHTAYREAEVAVNHILQKPGVMRYDAVPSVIYTTPEVACVGETLESLETKGTDAGEASLPMAHSGRFVAENQGANGLCKIVFEKKSRRVKGVHMLGSYASEIIAAACVVIEKQMRVEDVTEIIFPHPTVSEIIKETAFSPII